MTPLVSIILPTFNGGKTIANAIQSVLRQNFTDYELLVIDDGSTDDVSGIIKSFNDTRIKYLKNEKNSGLQKTLNRGLKNTQGKYIARIDDDDEWMDRDKLGNQINFLEKNKDHLLVGTGVMVIGQDGKEKIKFHYPKNDRNIRRLILGKNCFVHSSVVFDKKTALNLGGYDESEEMKHVEDYDLWLKFGTIGKFANLPDYAVKYNFGSSRISKNNRLEQAQKIINLAKKYKKTYPNYYPMMFINYSRILLYKYLLNKSNS